MIFPRQLTILLVTLVLLAAGPADARISGSIRRNLLDINLGSLPHSVKPVSQASTGERLGSGAAAAGAKFAPVVSQHSLLRH